MTKLQQSILFLLRGTPRTVSYHHPGNNKTKEYYNKRRKAAKTSKSRKIPKIQVMGHWLAKKPKEKFAFVYIDKHFAELIEMTLDGDIMTIYRKPPDYFMNPHCVALFEIRKSDYKELCLSFLS